MTYEQVEQEIAEMLELWSNNPHVYLGYDIGHGNPVSFQELAKKVLSHPRIVMLKDIPPCRDCDHCQHHKCFADRCSDDTNFYGIEEKG